MVETNIILYYNSAESFRVDKTNYLEDLDTIEGVFRDEVDIFRPVIRLQGQYEFFNYVYIEKLRRYYYVDDIKIINADFFEIYLSLDVLHTYRKEIKDAVAFVDRNEAEFNPYITDDTLLVQKGYGMWNETDIGNDLLEAQQYDASYVVSGYLLDIDEEEYNVQ